MQVGQGWRDRAGTTWHVEMPHRLEGLAVLEHGSCRRSVSFEELGRDYRLGSPA